MHVAGTSRAHVVTSAGHVLATLRVHIATRFPRPSLHTRFDFRPHLISLFLFTSCSILLSLPVSSRNTLPSTNALIVQSTMSDPEPSVATSSSPSLPAVDSNALTYAFLVHSQKTLTQNLPPRVDNKLLARQKRRRTRYVLNRSDAVGRHASGTTKI